MYPAIVGLQPEWGWESSYGETADGLPYIGPHRNYPRHLFALGGAGDSLTGAFLAARVLGDGAAKHARRGTRVGLCDLTAGEMGSNGTVEERLAEAEDARKVLGAVWRLTLRWPDRAIG